MTLKELYAEIGGDYDQALRVLRVERLLDKHIRKLPANEAVARLLAAEQGMDATELFESAHAIKGLAGNLGLTRLAAPATEIAEQFRPGNERTMSDDEVRALIHEVGESYEKAVAGIASYAG